MKRKILGILVVTLLITSLLGSLVNADEFDSILDISSDEASSTFQLTTDDLDALDDLLSRIEDREEREKLQDIFDEIISADGVIDLDAVKSIAQSYFTEALELAGTGVCDEADILIQPVGTTLGASTVFEPPYSCIPYEWGEKTDGEDDFAHSGNQYSGSIGTYAHGWIGGGTAEVMQGLRFYVGRTKTISVDGKLIYMGGGTTVGFGAFAGTEKTWYHDDTYGRADLDSPWDWDDILFKIIGLVTLFGFGTPATIREAINIMGLIAAVDELGIALNDLINAGMAEVRHATFSFSASGPGWHTVYVGMRATASGFITGTGTAVAAGQVASITLGGYGTPYKPDFRGPWYGDPGETLEFCVLVDDANGDPMQVKFDFGDGTTTDWSDFVEDRDLFYVSHVYENEGSYQLRAKAKDCDLLESGWMEVQIKIQEPQLPDLYIFRASLGWADVAPGFPVFGDITLGNCGDPGTHLNWEITEWPSWGSWTFDPMRGSCKQGDYGYITVRVVAPDVKDSYWYGEIKIVNINDPDDFEILSTGLATPKDKVIDTPTSPFFSVQNSKLRAWV